MSTTIYALAYAMGHTLIEVERGKLTSGGRIIRDGNEFYIGSFMSRGIEWGGGYEIDKGTRG